MRCNRQRTGFTLVELLVVMAIIAMLAALLMPAVNQVREQGRRTTCMNNQHQLGLATQLFETQNNRLPGWAEPMVSKAAINNSGTVKTSTWVWPLLPNIERGDIYRAGTTPGLDTFNVSPTSTSWGTSVRPHIKILTCPNDSSAINNGTNISYVANCGMRNKSGFETNPAADEGGSHGNPVYPGSGGTWHESPATAVFFSHVWDDGNVSSGQYQVQQTLSYVSSGDGSSNTLMFAENVDAGDWAADSPKEGRVGFCFFDAGTPPADTTNTLVMNSKPIGGNESKLPRASSYHPGGVVVTFCDGHNGFISQDIAYSTWTLLFTPRGDSAVRYNGVWPGTAVNTFQMDNNLILNERF